MLAYYWGTTNLDGWFRKIKLKGQFTASWSHYIAFLVKFLLQSIQLLTCECCTMTTACRIIIIWCHFWKIIFEVFWNLLKLDFFSLIISRKRNLIALIWLRIKLLANQTLRIKLTYHTIEQFFGKMFGLFVFYCLDESRAL